MQGYATLADETVEQLSSMGIARPTHVLLQGGVGAMAGGVLGYPPMSTARSISIPLSSSRSWPTVSTALR